MRQTRISCNMIYDTQEAIRKMSTCIYLKSIIHINVKLKPKNIRNNICVQRITDKINSRTPDRNWQRTDKWTTANSLRNLPVPRRRQ